METLFQFNLILCVTIVNIDLGNKQMFKELIILSKMHKVKGNNHELFTKLKNYKLRVFYLSDNSLIIKISPIA